MAHYRVKREAGDMLAALYRGRWVVAGCVAASLALVVGHMLMTTPLYEAGADVLLKFGREYVYRPEVGEEQPRVTRDPRDLVNSEIQILASRELARATVAAIGATTMYPGIDAPPRRFTIKWLRRQANAALALVHPNLAEMRPGSTLERAALAFSKRLKIDGVGKTDVVRITFRHSDPEMASRAVATLVEEFKAKRLQALADPQADFLAAQVEDYRARLEAAEQDLEDFRQTHRLYDLAHQKQLLLEQRSLLDAELKTTEGRVEEAAERLQSLREQEDRIEPTVPLMAENQRDPVVDDAKSRLLGLRLEEKRLLAKFTEQSKFVADVREQIALVEAFLQQAGDDVSVRTQTGKNQVYDELTLDLVRARAEHRSLIAKREALQRQIDALDTDLAQLDAWENELAQFTRAVESERTNYATYLGKLEDAKVSEELNRRKVVNVSVIEPPAVPLRPVTPQKTFNLAAGLVLGLALGLGLVGAGDHVRPRLLTADNAEQATGLPVLARLPDRQSE